MSFHPNGEKKNEIMLNDSAKSVGKSISYRFNGTKEVESDGLINGVNNGTRTEFFEDGSKCLVYTLKNDVIQKVESFDAKGESLFKAELASDGTLPLKMFYPDGIIQLQGTYLNGNKEGIWKQYNPHGILESELTYHDGMQSGTQKYYYFNGQVKQSFECDSNRIVGDYVSYHHNGQIDIKGHFVKNGWDGLLHSFNEKGQLLRESYYGDNERVGRTINYSAEGLKSNEVFYNSDNKEIRTVFYDFNKDTIEDAKYEYGVDTINVRFRNGKPQLTFTIDDNHLHGEMKRFYPDGRTEAVIPFKYGQKDGLEVKYDYDGKILSQNRYVLGDLDSISTTYNNGQLIYNYKYVLDNECGINTDYHYNGKVYRAMSFDDGDRHGFTDYFAPDGNLMYRVRFFRNTMKGYTYKNANGQFVPEIPITAQTSEMICYYPNGKLSMKVNLKNGEYHGDFKCYYADGKTLIESTSVDDEYQGVRRFYYLNGKVNKEMHYEMGQLHGLYTEYDEMGRKRKEGNYTMGTMTGEWNIYDATGKLKTVLNYFDGNVYEIKTVR
jgi:antitoxin component YwqK of YwqJK toxin-antitoxin module